MLHAHLKPQASTGTDEMVFLASSVFYASIVVTCLCPVFLLFVKKRKKKKKKMTMEARKSINRSFPPVVLRD